MRVRFSDIFEINPNGTMTPKTQVHLRGVTMHPGVAFSTGVSFGGVDLGAFAGKDLEVEQEGGVTYIKGHYP